jgi:hypothetical protein
MTIRIIKNIQIFFLFLAGLVLNAHMMIPHDHHQADSDFCREISYPVSKTGSAHHQGLPVHCHAFNDLTSGKVTTSFFNKQTPVRDLILDCVFEGKVTERQFSVTRHVDVLNSSVAFGHPGLSSLRAPPTFV